MGLGYTGEGARTTSPHPASGCSDGRGGVLAKWVAWPLPSGVPDDGGGPGGPGRPRLHCRRSVPSPGEAYRIPGRVQRGTHQALLYSGCMQTMVHQHLAEAFRVSVRCVHGDVHEYPLVPIEICYMGKTHRVKAVVSPSLTHPLVLGLDWAGFPQVARGVACTTDRDI